LLSSPVSRSRSGMSIVLFCTQLGAIQPRRRRCLRIISPIEKMSARGAPRGGAPAGLFGPPCCCHNDHCYRRDCELPVEMTSRSPQQLDRWSLRWRRQKQREKTGHREPTQGQSLGLRAGKARSAPGGPAPSYCFRFELNCCKAGDTPLIPKLSVGSSDWLVLRGRPSLPECLRLPNGQMAEALTFFALTSR
jgi:hypothetical protein